MRVIMLNDFRLYFHLNLIFFLVNIEFINISHSYLKCNFNRLKELNQIEINFF
jgi:hypothetical protein